MLSTMDLSTPPHLSPAVSIRPYGIEDDADGTPHDADVADHRPIFDIVEVNPDALLPAQVGPSPDLPLAGQARFDLQAPFGRAVVLVDVGAGSDNKRAREA